MGFSFKGTHSSTFDGFYFKTTSLPLLPAKIIDIQTVIGSSGKKIRFDNGYEDRYITLSCVFANTDLQQRRTDAKELINWLTGEGSLVFDYEPNRIYNARIEDEIAINIMGDADEFEITFVADPYCLQSLHSWSYTDFDSTIGSISTPSPYNIGDITAPADGTVLYPILTLTAKGAQTNQAFVLRKTADDTDNIGATNMDSGKTLIIDAFNKTARFSDGSPVTNELYDQLGDWFSYTVGTDGNMEVYVTDGDIFDVSIEFVAQTL